MADAAVKPLPLCCRRMGSVRTAKAKADLAEHKSTLGQKMQRRKLLLELRGEAAEFCKSLGRNADPAEAVQQVLDNFLDRYEYATQKVYELEEQEYWVETLGGKTVHEWIREQERLGLQIVHVASKAAGMGLAERQIRVAEAQAALFAMVVEKALIGVGMSADDRRKAHELISTGMMDIEGVAVEVAAV